MLALKTLGARWTLVVLRVLLDRPHRFSELKNAVVCIPDRSLARVLDRLEREGIVRRSVRPARPPQVVYSLVKDDPLLRKVIGVLTRWGEVNFAGRKVSSERKRPSVGLEPATPWAWRLMASAGSWLPRVGGRTSPACPCFHHRFPG
ncbi:MAG: helix-turn-helix transcriptional regulator [Acidobacteria bacterium]|nr:helix-turn-helix transcriptional regulator [Acidobacteriota bacterium]